MGVSQSQISAYERGLRSPSIATTTRFAAGLSAELAIDFVDRPPTAGGWQPPTLAATAPLVASALAEGNHRHADRAILEFLRAQQEIGIDHRRSLVVAEPPPTGDRQYDALLGAIAEHLAFHNAESIPSWTAHPDRFLSVAWYWIDVVSRRETLRTISPAAFARRLVFIDPVDLTSV